MNSSSGSGGDGKVLLALSGGVDLSVVAAMLIRAIGPQLVCIHVNHSLMKKMNQGVSFRYSVICFMRISFMWMHPSGSLVNWRM